MTFEWRSFVNNILFFYGGGGVPAHNMTIKSVSAMGDWDI